MEKMKLDAFLHEFPFLRSTRSASDDLYTLNDGVESLSISIKRIDETVLDKTPSQYYWNGSAGVTHSDEIIDFILKDGTVIENAVKQKGISGSNYAHSSRSEWEGQSVLDGIYEKDVAERLKYVVIYRDDYRNWDNNNDCNYVSITIYKLPKGTTVPELVEKKKKEIEKQLKIQSDF